MKYLLTLLLFIVALPVTAQEDEVTYEIRYWQNMSKVGSNAVHVDTMIYVGNDRAGFDYSSGECVSYFCKDTDKLLYTLMPRFGEENGEWLIQDKFVRRLKTVPITFRSRERDVLKVYVSDLDNKTSGYGEYSLVTKAFGVVCRWNSDNEFYQLIRIDIVRNDQVLEELDLLPFFDKIYSGGVF